MTFPPDPGPEQLVLAVNVRGDNDVVVHVAGDIDMATSPALDGVLSDVLLQRPDLLALDLSEVTFFGSAGVHTLVRCHADADTLGSRVLIERAGPRVTEVLGICGVAGLFGLPD
ncbi:STAS domain-containing protein [Actinoplanes sp. CA-131856]